MPVPIQSIGGFIIPMAMDEDKQNAFIGQWTMQHSEEHLNLYGLLGELENALGLPPFKFDVFHLQFDPRNINQVNDFIHFDNFQHEEMYSWLNNLGSQLVNYNKPVLTIKPRLNPMVKMLRIDTLSFNSFFALEKHVHMNLQNAVNALYQAYGVA
jgi:hypothetical protein